MHTHHTNLRMWIAAALVAAATVVPAAHATGPDDRAAYRGNPLVAPATQGPDDRALYRGTEEISLSVDDRPFARNAAPIDPGSQTIEVISSPSGFDWSDAAVGGTFGLVVALVGIGAILIVQRRRHTLTPA
jgi:hypothetical protein